MNCLEWETRVALHAGGDLTGAEAVEVERHLGECSGCRIFWSELRDSLAVLQAAHAQVPAAAHFTAVRSRVMAELERSARPWRWVAWIAAAAAVSALLVAALRPARLAPMPEAPRLVASIPPAPQVAEVVPVGPLVLRKTVAHIAHTPRRAPLTIKLQTDDPNIVIYWIAD
jgi:Putative zinc-finger